MIGAVSVMCALCIQTSEFNASAYCSEKHKVPIINNPSSCSFEVVLIVRLHILQRYKPGYYKFL